MTSVSRHVVPAVGMIVMGILFGHELHGQDTPSGGACPGDPRSIKAGLLLWEERTGGPFAITYRLIAEASQQAEIPTGHEMLVQMQRWQANAEGQFEIADVRYGPYSDMTCLHYKTGDIEFFMTHVVTVFGPGPPRRPCWKAFSGHAVKGTKTYRLRVPTVGERTLGCGVDGMW